MIPSPCTPWLGGMTRGHSSPVPFFLYSLGGGPPSTPPGTPSPHSSGASLFRDSTEGRGGRGGAPQGVAQGGCPGGQSGGSPGLLSHYFVSDFSSSLGGGVALAHSSPVPSLSNIIQREGPPGTPLILYLPPASPYLEASLFRDSRWGGTHPHPTTPTY